jgi:hypothetical protein
MPYSGRLSQTLFQQLPILGHLRCNLGCKFSSFLTPGHIRNYCNYRLNHRQSYRVTSYIGVRCSAVDACMRAIASLGV